MPQYIIQKNDNLGTIAARNGTDVGTLLKLNPGITNPDLIKTGAALSLPETGSTANVDTSARSLPDPGRTLDNSGGGTPGKQLPAVQPTGLLAFSSAIQDAVNLAKQKRQRLMKSAYDTVAPPGKLPASDFADFISNSDQNAQNFTAPLVKSATDAFQTTEDQRKKDKETIQGIAEKAAAAGAPESVVKDIISQTDVESALMKSVGHLKSVGGGGTGGAKTKYTAAQERELRDAGLLDNPDPNVKAFFLNTPTTFRDEWTRNYSQGANKDANIVNIGQSLDDWQNIQDSKKKKSSTSSLEDEINNLTL